MSASRLRQRIELASIKSRSGRAGGGSGHSSGHSSGHAGEQARIAGQLAATEMPRVARLLANAETARAVTASLDFWCDASGLVIIDGAIQGKLPLLCQRCLEEFEWQLRHEFRLALQDSESGSRVPQDLEVLDGIGDSIVPADLIEEEILLAMPLAPGHPNTSDCGPLAKRLAGQDGLAHAEGRADGCVDNSADNSTERGAEGDTAKPFAGLASLLPANDKLE